MLPTWAQVEPILIQGLSSGMLQNLKAESLYFLGNRDKHYFVLEMNFLPSGSFPSSYTFPPGSDAAKVDGTPCILPPPGAAWSYALGWGP